VKLPLTVHSWCGGVPCMVLDSPQAVDVKLHRSGRHPDDISLQGRTTSTTLPKFSALQR